jgi:hypothetical protein
MERQVSLRHEVRNGRIVRAWRIVMAAVGKLAYIR